MNYRTALALVLLSLTSAVQASSSCSEREQDIQREISYAKKYHNQHRVDGLNTALSEVRANCSDSDMRAKHQRKIDRQKTKVEERREDLREARKKGDPERISRREKRLAQAERDLKELQDRDH